MACLGYCSPLEQFKQSVVDGEKGEADALVGRPVASSQRIEM